MFSADATVHSAASQRPRRRQRTGSDDSVKLPKAKRQRSVLRHDTFQALHRQDSSNENPPVAQDEHHGLHLNAGNGGLSSTDLVYRGPRKSDKRGERVDGQTTLTTTDFYSVFHLPSLPEQIRRSATASYRCTISAKHGYALALTPYEAIIWPYASSSASPGPHDVLTLPLPTAIKTPSAALPFGAFVSKAATGDPGLVIIEPSSGKITYWETVSNASILGLMRQKQNGIQGSIPGMLSGEIVIEIINAEPSGLIVTFSTGRVAHIALRDSQGKPSISVEFLRGTSRHVSGGLFGGIKNVFGGGSWRKEVAAVKTGRSSHRGQREIAICTTAGCFELWDTHWNNGNSLQAQLEVREEILRSLEESGVRVSDEGLRILDFEFREPAPDVLSDEGGNQRASLLVLVSLSGNPTNFFLVELAVLGDTAAVGHVYPIDCYQTSPHVQSSASWKPRLFLSSPDDLVFIVFETSIILLTLPRFSDSPSSQLLVDSKCMPAAFQDCIRLRADRQYRLVGCGVEERGQKNQDPACIAMLDGFGLIRVTFSFHQDIELGFRARVSAKTRLEQSIFFGNMSANPLDFDQEKQDFAPEEVEQAALEISDDILRSTCKFIPTATPSLEQQMRLRSQALDSLAKHLRKSHRLLSRVGRWRLLWGAEKLAVQRALWTVEQSLKRGVRDRQTHLDLTLRQMGDKFRTMVDSDKGETDVVRHWFIHDTWRIEHLIPWVFNGIRQPQNPISKSGRHFAEQLFEASETSCTILETAFQFREDNATLYGLGDEPLDDGVLTSDYHGLPVFWTSSDIGYVETERLLNLELDSCLNWLKPTTSKNDALDSNVTKQVEKNAPRQFRVFSRMHVERTRWMLEHDDKGQRDEGRKLQRNYLKNRKLYLFKIGAAGQLDEAISLAESSRDMEALVELIVEVQDQLEQQQKQVEKRHTESPGLEERRHSLKLRIDKYFERFGEGWANAFFARQISSGQPHMLFIMQEYQPHVTRFLRKRPAYSKISWINDIVGEKDYNTASEALAFLATKQESDLWSRRVELSLGKLAKLAAIEKSVTVPGHPGVHAEIKQFDDHAEISGIQEALYEHVQHSLHGAIDQKAEVQLAIEQFGNLIVKGMPALREILEYGLTKLVARECIRVDQLVDLLTLMDPVRFLEGEDDEIVGHEFYLALRVLRLSDLARSDPPYFETLERLIWRRCMIRDDWEIINKTEEKRDNEVESTMRATALFRTLAECQAEVLGDNAKAPYRLYTPSELSVSSTFAGGLEIRFRPEERARIARDFDAENKKLERYIEKGRLDVWFTAFVDSPHEFMDSTAPNIDISVAVESIEEC